MEKYVQTRLVLFLTNENEILFVYVRIATYLPILLVCKKVPSGKLETSYHKSTLLQIREGLSEFVDQDGGLKVRIQWELNYLLFQSTFSQNDEVARFHNIQMRYRIIKEAFL